MSNNNLKQRYFSASNSYADAYAELQQAAVEYGQRPTELNQQRIDDAMLWVEAAKLVHDAAKAEMQLQ